MKKIYLYLLLLVGAFALQSCKEKEMVILDSVPLRLNALYMVGNAAPCGWSIDNPTPMTKSETDKFVFFYDGHLNEGEFKLPHRKGENGGDWSLPYFMPVVENCAISSAGVADSGIKIVPDGNPDWKWNVTEAGDYLVEINIRDMTITATFKN